MNVLIVDDSKMNIKVAEDTLREYHIVDNISTCLSGEEALEILSREAIDLILLDIVMPNITGVELLKILKQKKMLDMTKVVMLTTVDDFMVLKECFDLGATDYINKPFNKIEFTARVKSVLSEIESEKKLVRALELMERQNVELIRVNKMLSEAQAFMIEKEKHTAIGELVSGFTKDIKEPLVDVEIEMDRVIKKLDILDEAPAQNVLMHLKSNVTESLMNSQQRIKKIQKLINQLKQMSKDHNNEKRVPARLSDLLEETLLVMGHEVENIDTVDKKYGDPSMVICNKGLVKKAMLHCIQNAVYAMKDNENKKLMLKTMENDKVIMCMIGDNGSGIEKGIRSNIFDPFYTTKPKKEHMGIGLSIVHEVVANVHAGQIDVETDENSGTVITLIFNK